MANERTLAQDRTVVDVSLLLVRVIVGVIFASILPGTTAETASLVVLSVLGGMALLGTPAVLYLTFGSIRLPVTRRRGLSDADISQAEDMLTQPVVRGHGDAEVRNPLTSLSA